MLSSWARMTRDWARVVGISSIRSSGCRLRGESLARQERREQAKAGKANGMARAARQRSCWWAVCSDAPSYEALPVRPCHVGGRKREKTTFFFSRSPGEPAQTNQLRFFLSGKDGLVKEECSSIPSVPSYHSAAISCADPRHSRHSSPPLFRRSALPASPPHARPEFLRFVLM